MYLNVSTGDHAIFQEHKVQKFSCNSYDDIELHRGILTVILPGHSRLLIDHSYM
jgi:hypothetical protein